MNETSTPAPEPESVATPPDSAAIEPAAAEDVPRAPQTNTRPSFPQRVLITSLFLVMGLAAGFVAWQLQSEFILRADPLAPGSGWAGQAQPDLDISLYGLEYAFQAFGIPPKQSSFNVLEGPASASQGPTPTSPNPVQVQAQMQLEREKTIKETSPRKNRVAVYLMLLGIMLGAATGLSEGIRRRSILMIIGGVLACAVLAGAAGFLGGALHARADAALTGQDLNREVALMVPQFVAWLILGLGLIAWPLAMNPSRKAAESLATAAIAGALLCSLIYVPLAQQIFYDDRLERSLPGHVYSFLFWFLFGSGVLSLLVGNACANIGRQPAPAAE